MFGLQMDSVDANLKVIESVSDMLLAIVRSLQGYPPDLGARAKVWESVLFYTQELAGSVNDLGAGEDNSDKICLSVFKIHQG